MKRILPVAAALCLAAGTHSAMGGVSDEDYPYRKPGLWEVTLSTPEYDGLITELLGGMTMCIDRDTDKFMLQGGQSLAARQLCSKSDMKVEGKTVIIETECTVLGMHATGKSTTTVRDESFHTEIESRANGQPEPMRLSQEGRWIGPCPSDLKPGEISVMNGALRFDLRKLTEKASRLFP